MIKHLHKILSVSLFTIASLFVFSCANFLNEKLGLENAVTGTLEGYSWHYNMEKYVLTVTAIDTSVNEETGVKNSRPAFSCDLFTENTTVYSAQLIILEEGITEVADKAFSSFKSLSKVTIPSTVTKVGSSIFCGFTKTVSIDTTLDLETWDSSWSDGMSGVSTVSYFHNNEKILLFFGSGALQSSNDDSPVYSWSDTDAVRVIIKPGLTNLPRKMFFRKTGIKSINIPSTVTNCEYPATVFAGWNEDQTVTFDFTYEEGKLKTSTDSLAWMYYLTSNNMAKFSFSDQEMPETDYASWAEAIISDTTTLTFRGRNFTELRPSDITNNFTYSALSAVTNVVIPEGVTYLKCTESIVYVSSTGYYSSYTGIFNNFSSLQSISLPSTLTDADENTFTCLSSAVTIYLNWVSTDRTYRELSDLSGTSATIMYLDGLCTNKTVFGIISHYSIEGDTLHIMGKSGIDIREIISAAKTAYGENFSGITKIIFDEGITSISGYLDGSINEENITSITLPETLKYLDLSFSYCTNVSSITIPANVTDITYECFSNWTSSQSIYVNKTDVTEVEKLTALCNTDAVVTYGDGTLFSASCSISGTTLTFSGYSLNPYRVLKKLENSALSSVSAVVFAEGITNIDGSLSKDGYDLSQTVTSIVLPSTLTNLSLNISEFNNISSITIPESVTYTDFYYCFYNWTPKQTIILDWNSSATTERTMGSLLNCYADIRYKDGSRYEYCKYYVIEDDTVTVYGNGSICVDKLLKYLTDEEKQKITKLVFAEGLTSLENSMNQLADCVTSENITSVTLPESLTAIYISFSSLTKVPSITIPSKVQLISEPVFSGWTASQKIYLSWTSSDMSSHDECYGLASTSAQVYFSDNTLYSSGYTITGNTLYITGYTPNLTYILSEIQAKNSTALDSITQINFEEGIVAINGSASYGNLQNTVTSIILPSTLKNLYVNFNGFTKVTSITIPASVENIDSGVFENWTSSQTINLDWASTDGKNDNFYAFRYTAAKIKYSDGTYHSYCKYYELNGTTLTVYGSDSVSLDALLSDMTDEQRAAVRSIVFSDEIYSISYSSTNALKDMLSNQITSVTLPSGLNFLYISLCELTNISSITIPTNTSFICTDCFYGWTASQTVNLTWNSSEKSVFWKCFNPEAGLEKVFYADGSAFTYPVTHSISGSTLTITTNGLSDSELDISCLIPYSYNQDEITEVIISGDLKGISSRLCDYFNPSILTAVTLPSALETINGNLFCNCTAITSVHIPSSITYINAYAFEGFTADQTIYLDWPSTDTTARTIETAMQYTSAKVYYSDGVEYSK